MANQSPIKVSQRAKEKIHFVAAVSGKSQAHVVESAIEEYVARHASELEAGLRRAHEALLSGQVATAAYLLGEDPTDVARVSGTGADT